MLELPVDRPRPPAQSFRGAYRSFGLSSALSRDLRALCRRRGVTLFMALLSAFEAMLSRLTRQEVFAVGTPIAGRNRLEVEGLIGFFVNTLVLRADVSGDPSGDELLRRRAWRRSRPMRIRICRSRSWSRSWLRSGALPHAPLCQVDVRVAKHSGTGSRDVRCVLGLSSISVTDFTVRSGARSCRRTRISCTAFRPTPRTSSMGRRSRGGCGQLEAVLSAYVESVDIVSEDLPLLSAAERHQLVCEWSGFGDEEVGTICALFAAAGGAAADSGGGGVGEER